MTPVPFTARAPDPALVADLRRILSLGYLLPSEAERQEIRSRLLSSMVRAKTKAIMQSRSATKRQARKRAKGKGVYVGSILPSSLTDEQATRIIAIFKSDEWYSLSDIARQVECQAQVVARFLALEGLRPMPTQEEARAETERRLDATCPPGFISTTEAWKRARCNAGTLNRKILNSPVEITKVRVSTRTWLKLADLQAAGILPQSKGSAS